jgi:hemerythrin-like metal-binding protein
MATRLAAMDDLHHDFCEALGAASSSPDREFQVAYQTFVGKAERAFATEEQWMEEIDLPSLKSHREQHARVLGALHHVHSMVMSGDVSTGRNVVGNLLPKWYGGHVSTMDMVLAMSLQVANGQPMHAKTAASMAYVD